MGFSDVITITIVIVFLAVIAVLSVVSLRVIAALCYAKFSSLIWLVVRRVGVVSGCFTVDINLQKCY